MEIEIIATGEKLSEFEFFNLHPTKALPQPLTDEILLPYGAKLASSAPNPVIVPDFCKRRQGRLALLQQDLLDTVEAELNAIENPTARKAAWIEYESDTWERNNAFLQDMWLKLGGTPQSLDDLFVYAATL